jgi:hypothetical protein
MRPLINEPPLFMRDLAMQDPEYGSESSEDRNDEDEGDRPGYRSQIRNMMKAISRGERGIGRGGRGGLFRGRDQYRQMNERGY